MCSRFRSVPLLLLILGIFWQFGSTVGILWSLVAALTLYNAALLAEVFRAGILAVPSGQSEAAAALGLRRYQALQHVILPQAVRAMLPLPTSPTPSNDASINSTKPPSSEHP
jgi:glutamate transport system permease protein